MALLGLPACESYSFGLKAANPVEDDPVGDLTNIDEEPEEEELEELPGVIHLSDNWIQGVVIEEEHPIDIIFVSDSSGSLDQETSNGLTEREAVAAALNSLLITFADQGIEDFCIGAMLGHAGSLAGELRSHPDVGKACLCSDDPDYSNPVTGPQALRDDFEKNFLDLASDDANPDTDGGETGLFSFHTAMTTKLDDNKATGCFRDGATIIPMFFADENDICTSPAPSAGTCSDDFTFNPEGPAEDIDPDCKEPYARMAYCSDIDGNLTLSPMDVYQTGLSAFGGRMVAGVVGYVGDIVPTGGENERPFGYTEVVTLSGGDMVDLKFANDGDQDSFNAAFEALGETVTKKVLLKNSFLLSDYPCEETITVKVAENMVEDITLVGGINVLIPLNQAGETGDEIVIEYDVCEFTP